MKKNHLAVRIFIAAAVFAVCFAAVFAGGKLIGSQRTGDTQSEASGTGDMSSGGEKAEVSGSEAEERSSFGVIDYSFPVPEENLTPEVPREIFGDTEDGSSQDTEKKRGLLSAIVPLVQSDPGNTSLPEENSEQEGNE